jgi:hypothetical protein
MNKFMRLFRKVMHDIMMSLAPKWLRKLMLTCEQISQILASDEKIPILKRIKLQSHLLICQCCKDYQTQIDLINTAAHKIAPPELSNEQLSKISKSQSKLLNDLIKKD